VIWKTQNRYRVDVSLTNTPCFGLNLLNWKTVCNRFHQELPNSKEMWLLAVVQPRTRFRASQQCVGFLGYERCNVPLHCRVTTFTSCMQPCDQAVASANHLPSTSIIIHGAVPHLSLGRLYASVFASKSSNRLSSQFQLVVGCISASQIRATGV